MIVTSVRSNGSKRVSMLFDPKYSAKQSFREECDVNVIVSKYHATGVLPPAVAGRYGDFTDVSTYQDALNAVLTAQSSFEALPSKLRARFYNDPSQLLAFVGDPTNYNEAISLGLIPASESALASTGEAPAQLPT